MFYIEKLYLSKVGLNFVHFGINMKEWLWGKYFFTDEQKKIDLLLKHEFDWIIYKFEIDNSPWSWRP